MRSLLAVLLAGFVSPLFAADADKVGAAVAKAADYFRKNGAAGGRGEAGHGNGETALVGIAMLEAGIAPTEAAMKAVIQNIRDTALTQTQTYPVSLSVLFLDRLGDPADVPTIQMLGVRLYAGMNSNGGWGYSTWEGAPDQNELARLQKALQNRELETDPKAKPAPRGGKLHPEVEKVAAVVGQALRARGRAFGNDDNSNTQFGMIGLWVACRNGVPGRDAFALIERRFLASQNPRDAGWGYTSGHGIVGEMGMGSSTPAMTCAGLIGLALGAGARDAKMTAEKKDDKPVDPKKPADSDPFSNPNDPNRPKPAPKDNKDKDAGKPPANLPKAVQAALVSLGQALQAAQQGGAAVPGRGGPGMGAGGLGGFVGLGNVYYLLWSLERMAVAYSLDTVGGLNWYDFGADFLIPAQRPDGSWDDAQYGAGVNTAFAVLFLCKSNFTRDLSGKIKGTKDPGKTELRGGNGPPPLLAPPPKDPPKTGGKPEDQPAVASPKPSQPVAGGGFTLPPIVMPTESAEAEKVAAALLDAKDDDWRQKLDQARDTKGGKWSRALALVCAKTDGDKRKQAREALAERLTRMTTATLKAMLNDEDGELRRAACLAVAMKEEKALIGDVIDRLVDASDPVGRAARAALKSLSGVDFGPAPGADDDAKLAATTAWRAWHEAQKK